MTRRARKERRTQLVQAALDRMQEDMLWSAHRQAAYELAMTLTVLAHPDRFDMLRMPEIDRPAMKDALVLHVVGGGRAARSESAQA